MPEIKFNLTCMPIQYALIPPDHKRPRARRRLYDIERRIAAHAREVVGFAGERADHERALGARGHFGWSVRSLVHEDHVRGVDGRAVGSGIALKPPVPMLDKV